MNPDLVGVSAGDDEGRPGPQARQPTQGKLAAQEAGVSGGLGEAGGPGGGVDLGGGSGGVSGPERDRDAEALGE